MLNRRAHRRTRVDRDLEVIPLQSGRRVRSFFSSSSSAPSPAAGKLVDISCGGMAIEINGELDVGTEVDIHITDGSGKSQRARGTVRHVHGDNGRRTIGIAFTEPVVALGDPARPGDPVGVDGGEPAALVIDDDPGVRSVLKRFLESRGMKVTAMPSAEEGLVLLRSAEPALMMLDLHMGGMSGVELLETMRAEGLRSLNIWAMSGGASDDEALAALALGAQEFISKPFDLTHLDYRLQMIAPVL